MEHDAKRAGKHFDFRFKMPGSSKWMSFAVRKGIPEEKGKKVLAVRTTDHSRKEALLTGYIKDGYGAGKLTKWDGGSCTIEKYKPGKIISLTCQGKKMKGLYHLVSTKVIEKGGPNKEEYLLFKGKD